ncbi:hypothetical protein GCM10020295_83030 [Streptomyces cinereospinus]
MTAQPIHPHEPERVPRNAEGIAAALDGARRMEFYRELLAAAPEEAEGVLRRWWCEAMLDTDPAGRPADRGRAGRDTAHHGGRRPDRAPPHGGPAR